MTAAHSTVTASTFDVGRARTRRFDGATMDVMCAPKDLKGVMAAARSVPLRDSSLGAPLESRTAHPQPTRGSAKTALRVAQIGVIAACGA
jgi:hypothetical protein